MSAVALQGKVSVFGAKQAQNPQGNSNKELGNLQSSDCFSSPRRSISPWGQPSARQDGGGLLGTDRFPRSTVGQTSELNEKKDSVNQFPEKKMRPSSSMKTLGRPQERFEMTLQGGRMDILQSAKSTANTVKSSNYWSGQSGLPALSEVPDFNRMFGLVGRQAQMSGQEIFKFDPNGVTAKYTNPPMKKKSSVVIRKRPQSVKKGPIHPHNPNPTLSMTMQIMFNNTGNNSKQWSVKPF